MPLPYSTLPSRQLLGLVAIFLLISSACSSDDDVAQPRYQLPDWAEYEGTPATGSVQEQIDRFVEVNDLDTTVSSSGLVYQILAPGDGELIDGDAQPVFFFQGYRVDNRIVDNPNVAISDQPADIGIGALSEGLQLLRNGGRIVMLARPALAYGNAGFPSRGVTSTTAIVYELAVVDLLDEQ